MDVNVIACQNWREVCQAVRSLPKLLKLREGEEAWFRGSRSSSIQLLPSLFWRTSHLSGEGLDEVEQDLFFEFQARARELHERSLSDWDVLFFMRHHSVPTRILDWTDAFGVATYFAMDGAPEPTGHRCIWALNPYRLNKRTWGERDLVQPRFLGGVDDDDFWDYGELLLTSGPWLHGGPVAIYPLQIADRMRAQRGWFTFFGNSRKPLEVQLPQMLVRIDLLGDAIPEAQEFLDMAGMKQYSIYPDLDHLATELIAAQGSSLTPPTPKPKPKKQRPVKRRT